MGQLAGYAKKYRMLVSRIITIPVVFVVIFSKHSWPERPISDFIAEFVGFMLIGICTLGRLWVSMYISGYKSDTLITEGPYSMMRHPLYFFSLLGGIGLGFASDNMLVLFIIVLAGIAYYPFVMAAEEKRLLELHGDIYREYRKKTPGFFPRSSLFWEPELYTVHAPLFRRSFFDAMWFFWLFIILRFIERLHEVGAVPVLFTVP